MPKRKPDDGYAGVRILPSGTIAYSIREPDHAGVMHHRTITRDEETGQKFKSEYQASRARLRHQARIESGQRGRSRETLATYAATWLAGRRDIKPSTRRIYGFAVQHITLHLGAITLADLRPSDVRQFHAAMADAGLSPRTANMTHTILGMLLEAALTDDLIRRNPARMVKAPSPGRVEITVWETEQVRAFLAVADRHPYAAYWRIAIETGARTGELRALAWGDVNLREGSIVIRRTATVDEQSRPMIGDSPKTDSSRRTIMLSERAVEQLTTLRATATSTLVFPGQHGQLISTHTLRDWLIALSEQAGVPRIRMHDLRHTAATLMLMQGTPVHVVAAILGHASPTITLSIYAHALPSATREAVDVMARYIDGTQ